MLTAERARRAAQRARERAERLENFRARYWRYVESRGYSPEWHSAIGVLFHDLYHKDIGDTAWGDAGAPAEDQAELQAEIDELRIFAARAERYADDLEAAGSMRAAS